MEHQELTVHLRHYVERAVGTAKLKEGFRNPPPLFFISLGTPVTVAPPIDIFVKPLCASVWAVWAVKLATAFCFTLLSSHHQFSQRDPWVISTTFCV